MTQYSAAARDDYKRCVCDYWGSGAGSCPNETTETNETNETNETTETEEDAEDSIDQEEEVPSSSSDLIQSSRHIEMLCYFVSCAQIFLMLSN